MKSRLLWTTTPVLALLPSCLAIDVIGDQRGQLKVPVVSPMRHVIRSNPETVPTTSVSQVLEWWGAPDEREVDASGVEHLTYYDGIRWRGVLLFLVIVPVPLVIPVGHDVVELEVADGMVRSARTQNDVSRWEAFFGWPLHGMWCGVNGQPDRAVGDQFQRY